MVFACPDGAALASGRQLQASLTRRIVMALDGDAARADAHEQRGDGFEESGRVVAGVADDGGQPLAPHLHDLRCLGPCQEPCTTSLDAERVRHRRTTASRKHGDGSTRPPSSRPPPTRSGTRNCVPRPGPKTGNAVRLGGLGLDGPSVGRARRCLGVVPRQQRSPSARWRGAGAHPLHARRGRDDFVVGVAREPGGLRRVAHGVAARLHGRQLGEPLPPLTLAVPAMTSNAASG